ncbi:hypothetical protein [Cellulosimicrobium sp. Marseille-Q4280]|uniref:hypothetical protein n=1 Tax=Cellulosimicrobium sp. Marseille-Q4280 TaxID=2937992 RepID=UPI00203B1EFD|nr:hypothetical protein [Cellulosimicrobium sp. Marseille-Q4280]
MRPRLEADLTTARGDLLLERDLILIVTMLGDRVLTPLAVIAVQQELRTQVSAGMITSPEHLIDEAMTSISLRSVMLGEPLA